jgi:integrase
LSPAIIRSADSVLHNSLSTAVARRLIALKPAKGVRLPKLERRDISPRGPVAASAFLKAAATSRWEALCYVLLAGGHRPGEALALRWTDLDGTIVRVQRSLSSTADGAFTFRDVKTSNGRRAVDLSPVAVEAIARHRERQRAERDAAAADWIDLDLIFCTARGTPIDWRTTARRYIRPIFAAVGTSNFRPYDLRHSNATLLLLARVSPEVVSERLGHHSAAFLLDPECLRALVRMRRVPQVGTGDGAVPASALLLRSNQLVPQPCD